MKRILVVDDDPVFIAQVEKEIHQQIQDVEILIAMNYKDSIKHILSNDIDIALIDIFLPNVKEGIVIDFAIKKKIPTMVITGDSKLETQSKYTSLPIIEFIQKSSQKSIPHAVKTLARIIKNHNTNILIVDDSPLQLEKAKQILESMRLNITTAMNGAEALDIIENSKTKFSLVLTDYNMPVMDGMELTIKLREKYDKDELGIIVMTINDSPDIPIQFIKYGANDFVTKPFTLLQMSTRINSNLEILDLFASNAEKELQILKNAKNAQMGELIGNIAHQWRQPLSVISTSASGIEIQKDMDLLTDKFLYDMLKNIIENTKFLSKTIDSFSNYNNEKSELTTFIVQKRVQYTLDIIKSLLDEHKIKLINNSENIPDISILSYPSELTQVILNVIYNAKDILLQRDIKDRYINVELENHNNNILIKICDNGGGVDSSIVDKIFDPYFTTHHQSRGKGLGLYMSKDIVTKTLNGTIYVQNIDQGACFFIELPYSI